MKTYKASEVRRFKGIIAKRGWDNCIQAYQLNVTQGEGGSTIAIYLDVPIQSTGGMIQAGEWITKTGGKVVAQ